MSQTQEILNYLEAGNSLTPLECLQKFGCLRLGARIWDIEHDLNFLKSGRRILSEMITIGNKRVARYRLLKDGQLF